MKKRLALMQVLLCTVSPLSLGRTSRGLGARPAPNLANSPPMHASLRRDDGLHPPLWPLSHLSRSKIESWGKTGEGRNW